MNKTVAYALVAAVAVMSGCGKTGQTDSGLKYEIHTKNEGEKIKEGDFVKFHLIYKTDKDSVLQSTYKQKMPAQAVVDSMGFVGSPLGEYLYDALQMLTLDDSATFKMSVDSVFSADTVYKPGSVKPPRPPFIDSGSYISMMIKVVEVKSKDELEKELKETRDKQTKAEADTINDYVKVHNLEVKTTAEGIRYHIAEETEGLRPNTGDTVVVHYTGTLLDGTKFDSSFDRGEPITFPLVKGAVIDGWFKAIPLFKVGEKGIVVIPSAYAYGEFGSGPIPPNSPLVFEIELVDIKPKK